MSVLDSEAGSKKTEETKVFSPPSDPFFAASVRCYFKRMNFNKTRETIPVTIKIQSPRPHLTPRLQPLLNSFAEFEK
jgi:hypothetical protein